MEGARFITLETSQRDTMWREIMNRYFDISFIRTYDRTLNCFGFKKRIRFIAQC